MAPKVPVAALSSSHITLLALHYASSSDVASLTTLRNQLLTAKAKDGGNSSARFDVLSPATLLRVLLFLPESLAPAEYVSLLEGILSGGAGDSGGGGDAKNQNQNENHNNNNSNNNKNGGVDTSPVSSLSEGLAQRRLERLMEGIPTFDQVGGSNNGSGKETANTKTTTAAASAVTQWLVVRSRNIDTETGMLSLVQELLFPFMGRLPAVAAYFAGTVQVLSRLVYDADLHREGSPGVVGGTGSVEGGGNGIGTGGVDEDAGENSSTEGRFVRGLVQFEALPVASAVKYLLLHTSKDTVVKDIVTLVCPYLQFRDLNTRLEGWRVLWEWMVSQNLRTIYEIYLHWDGPQGVGSGDDISMQEYASTGMAACYLCKDVNTEQWDMMKKIQGRIVDVFGLRSIQSGGPKAFDKALYADSVMLKPTSRDLLSKENMLTKPSLQSLDLLGYLVSASAVLGLPLYATAQIRITGTKEDQKALLTRYVRQGNWSKRTDQEWKHVIDASRWMRAAAGVFEQLTEQECEEVLIRALLSATKFKMVEEIYVQDPNHRRAIGVHRLEEVILEAFQEFYDNASNGNMTRGGMKNAHLTLQILYPAHSQSPAIIRAHRLLKATHALSFYSLTLTPGVPLLPVQIRINSDPVSLLGRLLDQNTASYLQLDKLVPLAKDLHYGTSPIRSRSIAEEKTEDEQVERRVLGMCIESALAEDDFDTAYSLTKSRLKTPEGKPITAHKEGDAGDENNDESAWKACFQAGRYRSHSHHNPRREDDILKRLEMQMELLAEALRSCPAVACNQVLSEWMRKEDEMASVLVREAEQDEAHAAAANRGLLSKPGIIGGLPGGWSSNASLGTTPASNRSYQATTSSSSTNLNHNNMPGTSVGESEAPMGLFAVAAGAAKALGSTVRPLGAGAPRSATGTPKPGAKVTSDSSSPPSSPPSMGGSPQQQRRKRDIVGGMVTSGLASGLGWVLGAQPVPNPHAPTGK
ncbi:secretory pathway protein Sec39-domain-containing protein [Peziza echinospora]|nr:secretory pathway protein Sec39-domain-containing protein [Peziza echinospora]